MTRTSHIELAGGCYVVRPGAVNTAESGGLRWTRVIGAREGARKIAQFHALQGPGAAPVIDARDSDLVIFVLRGDAQVEISGREFQAGPHTGVHVRRGEAFRLLPVSGKETEFLITCCPGKDELALRDDMPRNFDASKPRRTVCTDESDREATGDRYFKLLVGPAIGSDEVTQFIGMIPRSKAPEHFHLYEEAICVLSGSGRMWTGDSSAPVSAGSIIFLPIRQPHCLECEEDGGLELVGVFYPAGSPAVNYATDPEVAA